MQQQRRSDSDDVAQVLAGDRQAFGRLFDRYARLVRAVLWQSGADHAILDDLVQETFLRAYRGLTGLRDRESFAGWVAGIGRQVMRESLRTRRRDRHHYIDQSKLEAIVPAEVPDLDVDDEIQFMRKQLGQLSEREQLAIHAYFLEERDAMRAAELVGLSRSGFYALLTRALAQLKSLVDSQELERERNK